MDPTSRRRDFPPWRLSSAAPIALAMLVSQLAGTGCRARARALVSEAIVEPGEGRAIGPASGCPGCLRLPPPPPPPPPPAPPPPRPYHPEKPDGTPCDDGDPCSVNDAYLGGTCMGHPKNCKHHKIEGDGCPVICDFEDGDIITVSGYGISYRAVRNRLLVSMAAGATWADVTGVAASLTDGVTRGRVVGKFPAINAYVIKVPARTVRDLERFIAQANADPRTKLASHDVLLDPQGAVRRR